MIDIIILTFSTLLFLILVGFPIASLTFNKSISLVKSDPIIYIALSLLIGLGVSSFAAATSYGIIGINSYFYILFFFLILGWTLYFIKHKKGDISKPSGFRKKDLFMLLPIFFSVYLSSSQWNGLFKPQLKVGLGPDVGQNLMAAQEISNNGSTWFSSLNSIKAFLRVSNFNDAAMDQFRVPSAPGSAAYDYTVFGTRWGLTVPINQILRILGPDAILYETGFVLLVSLISLSLIFFAIGKIVSKKYLLPTSISIVVISNCSLMYQYLNGGLSQILGAVSLSGLLLLIVIIIDRNAQLSTFEILSLTLTAIACWIGSIVCYFDATLIFALMLAIFLFLTFVLRQEIFKKTFLIISSSAIIAQILIPVVLYVNILGLKLRLTAASGTGTANRVWLNPIAHFGFVNQYPLHTPSNFINFFLMLIFVFLIAFLTFKSIKKNQANSFAVLGVSSILTIVIGFILSYSSREGTTYIYDKISVYLYPIVITTILILFHSSTNLIKKTSRFHLSFIGIPTILFFTIFSAINFQTYFFKSPIVTIPNEIGNMLTDSAIQNDLETSNYLIPYKPEYNYAALLGAKYWISKAPNDFILRDRLGNQLKLICFYSDPSCKPSSNKILNPKIEHFGFVEYESPLTTKEYSELSIDERYDFNFKVFGMNIEKIPEKFKGGNPYFK